MDRSSLYHLLKAAHPIAIASDEPMSSCDTWNWESSKNTSPNTVRIQTYHTLIARMFDDPFYWHLGQQKAAFFMIKPFLESSDQDSGTGVNNASIISIHTKTSPMPTR